MPISDVYSIKGGWAVEITRRNGTTYQVKSDDYQSMADYRNEYLVAQAKKRGINVR